jgi:hypothetical protein
VVHRFAIKSSRYGYLGGLSFSAAAWRIKSRDEWIGWTDAAHKKNLHLIVGNSRFLIAPTVRVKNLASYVLGQCVKRLGADWEEIYGYQPALLETFVERDRFSGTSYRASNWIQAGSTSGRGRQDRIHSHSVPIKDIYLYPLKKDAKKCLCFDEESPVTNQENNNHQSVDWVEEEFKSPGICMPNHRQTFRRHAEQERRRKRHIDFLKMRA